MPVLPLVLGWVVLAAEPTPPVAAGFLPAGSPADLHDLGTLALLRDPRVRPVSFSAADQNAGPTLAQIDGPGVLQRLWFGPPVGKGARLRITLDGKPEPALDIPLADLFAGDHPHFPRPLVGEWGSAFVCYVPIAFRDGCKVEVDGRARGPFQIDALKLPTAEGVTTFTATPTKADAEALRLARALWLEPEALWSNEPSFSRNADWRALSLLRHAEVAEFMVDAGARSTQVFQLPTGPRTVRSLEVIPTPKTADAWRSARLRLTWEGDAPDGAGVDLTAGQFFGRAEHGLVYRSLLVGQDEMTWYSYFPMPYRRQALLQIDAREPIKGLIRVRSLPRVDPRAGYFRAGSTSGRPGLRFRWLNEQGRGHLAGLFLEGEGPSLRWLRGVSQLSVDGHNVNPGAPPPSARGGTLFGSSLAHWFNAAGPGETGQLDQAQTFPLSGFPLLRPEGSVWRAAAYRWHPADPVPFGHSVTAEVEPGQDPNRAADCRAAVFWYSERPGPARVGR